MTSIKLGRAAEDGSQIRIPLSAFEQHFHLVGGTGKGKTTALRTILYRWLTGLSDDECFIILDRMGSFSNDLLSWFASEFCPDDVRQRLLYIKPARDDAVLPFNPLQYENKIDGYYRVARATDAILRAWDSQNIEAMPRLARWTFNAFWAAAQLGLTITDCSHLLLPDSEFHKPLLEVLPTELRVEWGELLRSRGGDTLKTLDSTRNRLKPYFSNLILQRMFGSTENRLDVRRFMEERRIVLVDLSQDNRLSLQVVDAIGGLILNEIFSTARSLPKGVRFPTNIVLDEFQNFVGADIEAAIPEVRQLGLRLILSHQTFDQLKRRDHDLTSLIFQAQSRLMFGVQGEDADLLAHELSSLTFDPMKIKEEMYTTRQLITGHRIAELISHQKSKSSSDQWNESRGTNWSNGTSTQQTSGSPTASENEGGSFGNGSGGSTTLSESETVSQTWLPEYKTFEELCRRSYFPFDEQRQLWAQSIRRLKRGEAILRLVDDDRLHRVLVDRVSPGHLVWSEEQLAHYLPEAIEARERLIEENFQKPEFLSPELIDAESERRIVSVIRPKIIIDTDTVNDSDQDVRRLENDEGPFNRDDD